MSYHLRLRKRNGNSPASPGGSPPADPSDLPPPKKRRTLKSLKRRFARSRQADDATSPPDDQPSPEVVHSHAPSPSIRSLREDGQAGALHQARKPRLRNKSLPPPPGLPSPPVLHPDNGSRTGAGQTPSPPPARHIRSLSSRPVPIEQPRLSPIQDGREVPAPGADARFSPAYGPPGIESDPTYVRTEPRFEVPPLKSGAASREGGLPYQLKFVSRVEKRGMNPAMKSVQVMVPGVISSDGLARRIRFDLIGFLSTSTRVFGAFAQPDRCKELAGFPSHVALKMIHKSEFPLHDEVYKNALFEVESMKRLAGQDFVNGALAVFHDNQFVYIVSKWHAGNLEEYVTSWSTLPSMPWEPLPFSSPMMMPPEVFRVYAAQLLIALQNLKNKRVVHNDIKPQNIFVTPNGRLVLSDFDRSYPDVSKAMLEQGCVYEDVKLEDAGGTYMYMAPEILEQLACPRKPVVITPRADLFSLGVTLLELALPPHIQGRRHFYECREADEFERMREERCNTIVIDMCAPYIHPEVLAFLQQLLSVDPQARGTISELMSHPLFHDMNWADVRCATPPLMRAMGNIPERAKVLQGVIRLHEDRSDPHPRDILPDGLHYDIDYTHFADWVAPSCLNSTEPDLHGPVLPVPIVLQPFVVHQPRY